MEFFYSPLEQFQILPLFLCKNSVFTITNSSIFLFINFSIFFYLLFLFLIKQSSIIPNRIQVFFEGAFIMVYRLIADNVGIAGKALFPYIFVLFFFILTLNVIGLVPYSFTVTSHLIVTFSIALFTFIGVNIICYKKHGVNMLTLFLPPGASLSLALLLIPIEFVSYLFRPISLSVRLFANMMAGHTLLKVIAGFAWTMLLAGTPVMLLLHFVPLGLLVLLMGLELGVALIQAYVFTILTCIYLNDAINLH
jgi:ATP synthase subunit 6